MSGEKEKYEELKSKYGELYLKVYKGVDIKGNKATATKEEIEHFKEYEAARTAYLNTFAITGKDVYVVGVSDVRKFVEPNQVWGEGARKAFNSFIKKTSRDFLIQLSKEAKSNGRKELVVKVQDPEVLARKLARKKARADAEKKRVELKAQIKALRAQLK